MFRVVLVAGNVDVGLSGHAIEKNPFFLVALSFLIKPNNALSKRRPPNSNVSHTLVNQNLCESISGGELKVSLSFSLSFLSSRYKTHLNF